MKASVSGHVKLQRLSQLENAHLRVKIFSKKGSLTKGGPEKKIFVEDHLKYHFIF